MAKQRLEHFYGTSLRARGSSQTEWRQLTVQSFVKYWKYSPITNSPAPDQCCWISFRRLDRVAPGYSPRDSLAKVLKVFTNSWSLLLDLVQNKGQTEWNPLSVQRCTKYNVHNTMACAILSKYNCVREPLNVNSSNSLPELRLVDVISWTGQVHQVHCTPDATGTPGTPGEHD